MVTAIVSIAMFLVMISLHEFGHFIVAKILNFKVDEFSVGMGPAIFKKQKRRNSIFDKSAALRWILQI